MDGLVTDIARAAGRLYGAVTAQSAEADASPSRAQDEVAQSLEALGLEVVHEFVIPDGL